jgi:hypothetical protein
MQTKHRKIRIHNLQKKKEIEFELKIYKGKLDKSSTAIFS